MSFMSSLTDWVLSQGARSPCLGSIGIIRCIAVSGEVVDEGATQHVKIARRRRGGSVGAGIAHVIQQAAAVLAIRSVCRSTRQAYLEDGDQIGDLEQPPL